MENRRKRTALEASLDEWYTSDGSRQKTLDDIVNGRAGFSLRTIDWLVTNYAARNPVIYTLNETGAVIDVNSMYKDVLRCFHKSGFDSFKRKGANPSDAALRQRNFFRWAIQNGVVDYVVKNVKEIEKDMAAMRKRQKPMKRKQRSTEGDTTITSGSTIMDVPNFARIVW